MSRFVAMVALAILAMAACQPAPAPEKPVNQSDNNPMQLKLPVGIEAPPPIPGDNPMTPAKVELGRLLFFDPRVSVDGNVSCATCHNPVMGFTDGRATSMGVKAQTGGRSAPTVINLAYATNGVFWDGRAKSLEEQALGPIANPIEMGSTHQGTMARLNGIPGYKEQFKHVFGTDDIKIEDAAKAIAAFERTIISGNSSWDRFQKGDASALSDSARLGWELFQKKAECIGCHAGFNLTDNGYHNIGVGLDKPEPDLGRYVVTKAEEDRGRFKTPTLREIIYTGPYMHDGSEKTLEDVVEFYNKGGNKNPQLDEKIKPLNLTKEEKANLVAFLKSLNGEGWQAKMPTSFPPDVPSK